MPELLRASHIKAWRDSSNAERLDARNGLLEAVHLDALFDRALISFTDQGGLIVAKRLPEREAAVFGFGAINRRLVLNVGHPDCPRHHREMFPRNENGYESDCRDRAAGPPEFLHQPPSRCIPWRSSALVPTYATSHEAPPPSRPFSPAAALSR